METQINTLDAVLSENPDVLCLSAGDMNSCQAQLETAMENGIPVVAFDSNVSESELVAAYCGTDNIQLGKMAAEKLVQAIGEKGKIAVLSVQEKRRASRSGSWALRRRSPNIRILRSWKWSIRTK